jgi:RES domain-containing protein
MNQFKSWDSYARFKDEVTRQRRYVRTPEAEEFLRVVASTCKARLLRVERGHVFWRAQLGCEWRAPEELVFVQLPAPHPPSRMKPLPLSATEGRANPKGIPYLYLATTKIAAISEVRPWIGAMVSLAKFETVRELSIVNCSVLHGQFFSRALFKRRMLEPPSPEEVDDIVWAAIDTAFEEPVTRADDTAEYAATQTIAELFRTEGHDGIAYTSAFGDDGYNVALFDLDSARQVDETVHETKAINFTFEERGP